MPNDKERLAIYQFMKEIIKERSDLSKQYYDLKTELYQLNERENNGPVKLKSVLTILDHEKNKMQHYNSFDQVSRTIVSILKQLSVPLSKKQIIGKLTNKNELSITLKNLTCTISIKNE
ncbi:hypothetical protein [Enterococcus avium]|uniref:Uncharacterized protein n=1 Tax=Enterococcus avium TaxID=33945 RepID=A0A437UPX3_ENTAV|nr:hypothetical protein [Enterococcus avium]RVU95684.1 hypothetical protein EK398_12985 [Enterococcus avium]